MARRIMSKKKRREKARNKGELKEPRTNESKPVSTQKLTCDKCNGIFDKWNVEIEGELVATGHGDAYQYYTTECCPNCGAWSPDFLDLKANKSAVRWAGLVWMAGTLICIVFAQRSVQLNRIEAIVAGALVGAAVTYVFYHCFRHLRRLHYGKKRC